MDAGHDTLKDVYFAENKILKTLPKMAKAASADGLKEAITSHLEETKGHVERLEHHRLLVALQPLEARPPPGVDHHQLGPLTGGGHRHIAQVHADPHRRIACRRDFLGGGERAERRGELQHETVAGGVENPPAMGLGALDHPLTQGRHGSDRRRVTGRDPATSTDVLPEGNGPLTRT